MGKSLIDKLKNTKNAIVLGIALAAASVGFVSCSPPGHEINNPPGSIPTASFNVSPKSGTGTLSPSITLNGSSPNGNITDYKVKIDDGQNGSIDRVIDSASPINRSDIQFSSSAYLSAEVTDSSGATSIPVMETVTVTNPLYYSISGTLQDNETQSPQEGLVRIYDSSNHPVDIVNGLPGDSGHNNQVIVTGGSFGFQIPRNLGLAGIVLQTEATDSSHTIQKSYVRTVDGLNYGDITSSTDSRMNPAIRVVPFDGNHPIPDLDGGGRSNSDYQEFANFVYYTNITDNSISLSGLAKWNFDDSSAPKIQGVEIMSQNPNTGATFSSTTQNNLSNIISNPSNPNSVFYLWNPHGNRTLSVQIDSGSNNGNPNGNHWTNNGHIDPNTGLSTGLVQPNDGWIVIEPVKYGVSNGLPFGTYGITENGANGNYFVSGNYLPWSVSGLAADNQGNIINTTPSYCVPPHEFERDFIVPRNYPSNAGGPLYATVPSSNTGNYSYYITPTLSLIENNLSVNSLQSLDKKLSDVINEITYLNKEKSSNILRLDFGANTLPY